MFMKKDGKTGKSRFGTFVDRIKPGDYLIIQFGHNDQKKYSPKAYASPEKYREFMMFFANEAKKRGATPVFATSVCRRRFADGKAVSNLAEYPDITRALAKENGIALVDLNAITREEYTKLGEEKSKELFNYVKTGESPYWDKQIEKERAKSKTPGLHVDDTHFRREGAVKVAGWFVENAGKQKLPIAECFQLKKRLSFSCWFHCAAGFTPERPVSKWISTDAPNRSDSATSKRQTVCVPCLHRGTKKTENSRTTISSTRVRQSGISGKILKSHSPRKRPAPFQ